MNTFEVFTAQHSVIVQALDMASALSQFLSENPNSEVRCIVNQEYIFDYLY